MPSPARSLPRRSISTAATWSTGRSRRAIPGRRRRRRSATPTATSRTRSVISTSSTRTTCRTGVAWPTSSSNRPYNAGSVAHAIYCFLDGETLHGDAPKGELEAPFVQTGIHNLGTNNRGAFVPLSSLKYVLLDSRAPSSEVDTARYHRIAIHFVDHDVLRGYSDRQMRPSRYGVTLSLVSPDQSEVKELAIPFTALKGIFYLKTWEGGESPML